VTKDSHPTDNWGGGTWSGEIAWPTAGPSKVYDLAVRLEEGMTHHAAHPPFSYTLVAKHGDHMYPGGISAAMELISLGAHVGTHVDAPGHVSLDGCVFGGRDVTTQQIEHAGVKVGSVEELPPLIGPGHLIDGELVFGEELTNEHGLGAAELEEWFAEHPAPEAGSIVLFRTGWMKFFDDSARYLGASAGIPGVTLSGARWLSDRGVRAVGADTVNFEHKRHLTIPALSVHAHLLVEMGIPIMESVNLEGLAADGIYEFFFAAAPLRLGGGTGSPIRPFAIVST
jgi:kynurenine formamidase